MHTLLPASIHCTMNAGGEKFIVRGGERLRGETHIRAAKNSVLPLIACSLLSEEDIILQNVPDIADIHTMLSIIRSIGGIAELKNGEVYLNCRSANPVEIDTRLTESLRASIFILGPALSRFRRIRLGLPGGCAIGARAIDIHTAGLRALGATVCEFPDRIECESGGFSGGAVVLRMPSVGATENLMMASVLGNQTTIIRNAAREPEIVDLANFINRLGGKVFGAGKDTVVIKGVSRLSGGTFRPSCDRIAAPTYLCAAAITGGCVTVRDVSHGLFDATLDVLSQTGCKIGIYNDAVTLTAPQRLSNIPLLQTCPHPGFPTDMQSQISALLSVANGRSTVVENLFESRFRYADQLNKLGARFVIRGTTAEIEGVKNLRGAYVTAEDLRGGAALVLAALKADGCTVIHDVHHIDRGYERFDDALRALGACIVRLCITP